MAGKPKAGGNAYKPLKPARRSPKPKASYTKRALSLMKKRMGRQPR